MPASPLSGSLSHWLSSFPKARLLCIGDTILDRFVAGDSHRLSPEAPVPVLRARTQDHSLGGAANTVRNVSALGAQAVFISAAGSDEAGKTASSLLSALPRVQTRLFRTKTTPLKIRFSAQHQQILRVDWENTVPLLAKDEHRFEQAVSKTLEKIDAMLICDYDKGVLSDALIERLIAECRKNKRPVLVDSRRRTLRPFHGATIFKPNHKELQRATGMEVSNDEAIVSAARRLMQQASLKAVVATRGAEGMSYIDKNTVIHIATEARDVYDVTGAGDTVMAVLGIASALQIPVQQSLSLANLAAGLVVAKQGTASVNTDEIKDALRRTRRPLPSEKSHGRKYMTPRNLKTRVEAWRLKGFKIGFVNGCFDLLHSGHVHLLESAGTYCDRLIVALNTDASVRRLKGQERPVHNEASRIRLVSALAGVHAVTSFAEQTPTRLVETLCPDVLVKGEDYRGRTIREARRLKDWGGEVVFVPLIPDQSTTGLIRRILKQAEKPQG